MNRMGEVVLFGNGYLGTLIDIKLNPKNKTKVICEVKPTQRLHSAYNLVGHKNKTLIKEYDRRDIVAMGGGCMDGLGFSFVVSMVRKQTFQKASPKHIRKNPLRILYKKQANY